MEQTAAKARFNMIQQQIRPWDVADDRVLEVMAELSREDFVPDAYVGLAYADIEVPIAGGQVMMAPRVVGRMLQALDPRPNESVLEIGTGTGYVTACLRALAGSVVSIERDTDLAAQARENLKDLKGIAVREADAFTDAIEGQPFDVIAVTGSLPSGAALETLLPQLKPGGRLFAIVGEAPVMEALLVTHIGAQAYREEPLFETSLPALANAPEPEHFVF